jgi:hypothetical protein
MAAGLLLFAGCDANEVLEPDTGTDAQGIDATPVEAPVAAVARRGIPIGYFRLQVSDFGSVYNGAHRNFSPGTIVKELSAIRARGGRVIIAFAGSPRHYLERGHFSMSKWKARTARFRGANITPFIKDGTVIGHYMIDEPNDPKNWKGKPVPPSVLEEMGRYSKQLWPGLATIVRVEPRYLSRNHRYVDAAWAQYLARKGSPSAFIKRNVADAQQRRLGLVVGLNVIHGGKPTWTRMTPSEVSSWGSALLSSKYPCAFINWTYQGSIVRSKSMKAAMAGLRRKAESRPVKSCKG